MDTRKLKVETSKNTTAHLHWDTSDPINTKVASMTLDREDREVAAEIVQRWNAFPDLLAALQAVWAAPGHLSKAIALGSVEQDGEKTGPYLNALTEQVYQAISKATNTL